MHARINIAIDGHSSCGKSTLAKKLAKELKYVYVDSGAMYRAVTLYCIQNGIIKDVDVFNEDAVIDSLNSINISFNYNKVAGDSDTYLNGVRVEDQIRELVISRNVSAVSKIRKVRERLVHFQQKLGKNKGVVMDGRDIGTVVFPDAKLKIFMTADVDIRAQRRYAELTGKGHSITLKEIKENLVSRDFQDSTRIENPLRKAEDAVELDSSYLTREQQLIQVKSWAVDRIENEK